MGLFGFSKLYCKEYKVKGLNPRSGRRKTVIVVATSADQESNITKKSGLLPPYEILPGSCEVTEGQLEVAKKYKIKFPKDATISDAAIILDRIHRDDPVEEKPVPRQMVQYAADNNVFIPKYAYYDEAVEILLYQLPDKKKEINDRF